MGEDDMKAERTEQESGAALVAEGEKTEAPALSIKDAARQTVANLVARAEKRVSEINHSKAAGSSDDNGEESRLKDGKVLAGAAGNSLRKPKPQLEPVPPEGKPSSAGSPRKHRASWSCFEVEKPENEENKQLRQVQTVAKITPVGELNDNNADKNIIPADKLTALQPKAPPCGANGEDVGGARKYRLVSGAS